MTKRLNSKHKVDRRLRVNLWGRPKSPFNTRAYPPGQHGQTKSAKPSDDKAKAAAAKPDEEDPSPILEGNEFVLSSFTW